MFRIPKKTEDKKSNDTRKKIDDRLVKETSSPQTLDEKKLEKKD